MFEEGIDGIVVEVGGGEAQPSDRVGEVGSVEHHRLESLVVVLLDGGDDEIDRVRERRVRHVVEQTGHLLAAIGAESAQQKNMDAEAMLVAGDVLEREGQCGGPGLADAPEALERGACDQVEDRRVVDRDVPVDTVIRMRQRAGTSPGFLVGGP